ncbi:sporulation protein YqfD [Virgibacillus sp. NKC19-16]|uniref:sporulation protein YqfD n=1 Tax=Virgibacillus salidurans TaxID=2831673 RepID=UPI001F193AD5|nr:sporulation protein YqfD [Virgibacillus sp. NKC19-16]UJL44876.1 sporulation protein YqfD [Virgibacillus sp. NKC19-16]
MKHKQGAFITGYVTILIKGDRPELFFQRCMQQGIPVWDVKKTDDDTCSGNVRLRDVKEIKAIKRKTDYKLAFTDKKGYPFFIKRFIKKKPLMIGLIMSIMLVIFLSNIIWEVQITGVPTEIEEKISEQLDDYGVHSGAWIFTLEQPTAIQDQLIKDVPELLWVGVEQKGTTFYLEGVEKSIVEEEEPTGPQHLVATKKGVIKNMYVSQGLPKASVNDYVEPGDVLVSGIINEEENEENEEDEEDSERQLDLVAAEGDITATTWYEVSVNVPLEGNYEMLSGEQEKKYYLGIGNLQLPIWGFRDPDYEDIHRETNENSIRFFNWELPVKFIDTTLSEKVYNTVERTKEEAINTGIQQAKNELKLQLGPESQIISENVLHETIESGKVKLNLYISVEENIAKAEPIEPISQGD